MFIILSPAKIQNGSTEKTEALQPLLFPQKTKMIRAILKKESKDSLGQLMKIKGKLLEEVFNNIHQSHVSRAAVELYNGLVFKEINVRLYDERQLDYMKKHLRILSANYGVLEPFTGIEPYRLDFTMKPSGLDLYEFWEKHVNAYFKDENFIVNLASIEFSKMIKRDMINIFFKEEQSDGSLKIITTRAKIARGLMVDYMINHTIETKEGIKGFDEMGYIFSEKLSTIRDFVFVMPYER